MRIDSSLASSERSCEDFGYRADDAWAKLPSGWTWLEATSVAVDSQDRVHVFKP